MSQFKLIMLSAMYENGGNTTHRLLDGHPELYVYPFESQVGTGAGSDSLSSVVPLRYRWPEFPSDVTPEQAYEMFWDEELKTLLRVPGRSKFKDCGLTMDEKKRKASFVKHCQGKPQNRATFVEAYYRSTFDAWENYNHTGEEKYHVGYNPAQGLDTDKIFADFPDAHVIHVVRNPYSGYSDTSKRPFPLSTKKYAWLWNWCQHYALTYQKKYAGNFHIVRFEDIVNDTKGTMEKLLNDMGLPFSENCLHASFNKTKLEEVYPWGTIRIPTSEVNISTANELNTEQKKEIQSESFIMQNALGYEGFLENHLS